MPGPLRDFVQQPATTKATIKQALHSPKGLKRVWCVVEAPDDVVVYQKFFDEKTVSVLPSDDENKRRSYRNVESIVAELYLEENNPLLLGIRDCDYTRYDETYVVPANIFLTDCRDIEMMMFDALSVMDELRAWNDLFPKKIESCAEVVRYLGYLRIYNELRQTSCRFHDKLTKVLLVWDFNSHTIKPEYKRNLFDKFKAACHKEVDEEEFNAFVKEKGLEEEPYVFVCRGHDMFNLLPAMMIQQEFSQSELIRNRMVKAFSFQDFCKTRLYAEISAWASARYMKVF